MMYPSRSSSLRLISRLIAGGSLLIGATAIATTPSTDPVRAAMLVYSPDAKGGICFSAGFLEVVSRETSIRVDTTMDRVELDSPELFEHPFVVMSGEGSFELTDQEIRQFRRYILSGGFILASAGCSDHAWGVSMERAFARAFPESPMKELTLEHPLFHTVFDIKEFASRKRQPVRIYGLELGGRLALLYSPQGLNDTKNTNIQIPGECCCCGGDEITSAKYINANALVYALVQ